MLLHGDIGLEWWHWGTLEGKEPSHLRWWRQNSFSPSCWRNLNVSLQTRSHSLTSTFARRSFPGQRNKGFNHCTAEVVGSMAGKLALVLPCHVCRPTHTAAQNSVTIWFQLPGDTGASPAPSVITKSEFKHQLNLTRPSFIPPPFFLIIQVCLLEKREGDNVCRAFNLLPKE